MFATLVEDGEEEEEEDEGAAGLCVDGDVSRPRLRCALWSRLINMKSEACIYQVSCFVDILKSCKSTSGSGGGEGSGKQPNGMTSPVDTSEARNLDVAKNYTGDVCS